MTTRAPAENQTALHEAVRAHGWNATSFQVLEPGFRYHEEPQGGVAYVDTGDAWVAAGAPLSPEAHLDEVAERFVAAAAACGRRACFFGTERRFVERSRLGALQIGEQPVWNPQDWPATLRGSRSLREQPRRARAKGTRVRWVAPDELDDARSPLRQELQALFDRWLSTREMAPKGFLVQVDLFGQLPKRRLLVAERDGAPVALASLVPVYARRGWFIEHLLRDPSAPNGTMELLVDAAMRGVAEEGATYLTLGLAPLAGDVPRWLRLFRQLGSLLYDFDGLAAFKSKLRPARWEPIFLSFPRGQSALAAVHDTLAAFSGRGLWRFGLETLVRGPALLLHALSALLVPWTVLMAVAGPRWFPAPWLKWAWVAFSAGLAVGLIRLWRRWHPRLVSALLGLVTADAVLSLAQVVAYNAARVRRPWEWLVLAGAVLGPSLAALILWRVRARHRRAFAGAAH